MGPQLCRSESFQQRQRDSSRKKVARLESDDLEGVLWIAEHPETTERIASIGVVRESPEKTMAMEMLAGRKLGQLGSMISFDISRDHRENGIGRQLLTHCLSRAANDGFDSLCLSVWRPLEAARSLHRQAGLS